MTPINDNTRRWLILAAAAAVLGMIVFDQTALSVALPTIRKQLHLSQIGSHWVINAYLLAFTVSVAVAGNLGDRFTRRGLFVIGSAIFAAGSAAAGIATAGSTLFAARAIQGIGAAIVFPTSLAMSAGAFAPDRRGLAFGIQTATGGTCMALGPLVGGWCTQSVSWRWLLWINLPVLFIVGVVVALAWLEPQREALVANDEAFDYRGALTWTVGLGAIVLASMQMPEWGWASYSFRATFAAGVIVTAAFLRTESRTSAPLIDVSLFRDSTFTAANLLIFAGQFSQIAVVVFAPLYVQQALRVGPLAAGFAVLPGVLPLPFSWVTAGRLADRVDARKLAVFGLSANGAAVVWIGAVTQTHGSPLPAGAMVLWGLTLPFLNAPARRVALGQAGPERQGRAAGISLTAQFLGGTLGITVAGTLLALSGNFATVYAATALVMFVALVTCIASPHPRERRR